MRKYYIIIYWLLISSAISVSWECSNQKIELQTAQSQNVDFLIEQAKLFWEQRSDSNAVIKANYFLGLANKIEKIISVYQTFTAVLFFFKGCF